MSKKTRGDKGEALVIECLNNVKGPHYLLNDVTFINKRSEMSHQIDHILIHPYGVFVIETKNYFGKITIDRSEGCWIKDTGKEKVIISNPIKQNKSHSIIVYKMIKGECTVIPVVVFVKNNAPDVDKDNVINLNDLILFIESYPYQRKMQQATLEKIYKTIKRNVREIDNDEHVENISYLKQMKKEFRDEMSYAIENRKCPRCGHVIINKGMQFFCSYCDFKFHL